MKGLLYKSITMLVDSYKKNLILVLVLYMGLCFVTSFIGYIYFLPVFLGLYAASAMTLDEYSHWDIYARTLPLGNRVLVGANYLVGLICSGAGFILAFLCGLLVHLLRGTGEGPVLLFISCLAAWIVAFFYLSLCLPLSYQFGAAKARNYVMIALAVIFVAFMAVGGSIAKQGTPSFLGNITEADFTIGLFVTFGCMLVVYLISYFISCAIYSRKEF